MRCPSCLFHIQAKITKNHDIQTNGKIYCFHRNFVSHKRSVWVIQVTKNHKSSYIETGKTDHKSSYIETGKTDHKSSYIETGKKTDHKSSYIETG
jgi:hypothetical protein